MHFSSIQTRIAIAFSAVILIVILTFIFLSYRFSYFSLRTISLDYTGQLVQQVSDGVDSYLKYMQDISLMVALNKDVEEYFRLSDGESYMSAYRRESAGRLLSSITLARTDIVNLIIFGTDDRPAITNDASYEINESAALPSASWYARAVDAGGEPVVSSTHVQNIIKGKYTYVVSLSRLITDAVTGRADGVVLVDLNYARISDLCKNISLGKRGYIFIVDGSGELVYHPQQQLIYSKLKSENIDEILTLSEGVYEPVGEEGKIYTIRTCRYADWRVVGVTYTDELSVNTPYMQRNFSAAGVLFILFATLTAYYIAHRISKPIKDLQKSMSEFERGNFDAKVEIKSRDEVGELAKRYNIMTDRLKELMEQNALEHELKRKNELKVLQSQINPHFLYNTLDSIIWMAENGQTQDVILMTSSLAKLFRISISKGQELITVENELLYIKSYLTIQERRYKDKFTYVFDVDSSLLPTFMLKLLLQPLVENAIYHGIKNIEGKGTIRITGRRDGTKAYLRVEDDGAGMSAEELKNVNEILSGGADAAGIAEDTGQVAGKTGGVGIMNVNQRLKLYFGDEYGLRFESEYEKGTVATIVMPVLWGAANDKRA